MGANGDWGSVGRTGEECGGEACGRAKGTEAKESKWPALAKMVKQYFAAPASSKGVERVFSAAGNMHGDLQEVGQGLNAGSLEHSLFAAFNTD